MLNNVPPAGSRDRDTLVYATMRRACIPVVVVVAEKAVVHRAPEVPA